MPKSIKCTVESGKGEIYACQIIREYSCYANIFNNNSCIFSQSEPSDNDFHASAYVFGQILRLCNHALDHHRIHCNSDGTYYLFPLASSWNCRPVRIINSVVSISRFLDQKSISDLDKKYLQPENWIICQ